MARQTNIVDFEAARASSRSRGAQKKGDARGRARSGEGARKRNVASAEERVDEPVRRSSRAAATSTRQSDGKRTQSGKGSRAQVELAETRGSRAKDEREKRRKNRTKARADKMFNKQFAGEMERSSNDAEGAPRAALYKGQMGSSQRRATRMQRVSEAAPVSAKINPAGWFAKLNLKPRTLRVATAAICAVLAFVFLYVPAQQYYQSVREHDRLEAEYSVLAERNEALDEQNDSLAGNAGMEDAVRQKYGYVVKGEQTAVVSGLSDRTTDSSRDSDNIEANVLSSSVKAPEEWYTPYLDVIFGLS